MSWTQGNILQYSCQYSLTVEQFRPPAFLQLLLCYAQTAHHEGQFLSNCAFFSIAQLILWHPTVRNLCSRLTWLTHQGHRGKSAAGTSDRSPGKLIYRASVWWSLLVACSPLTVPLRWALSPGWSVGVPVLHLISSCSLLWAVTFWSMAVAPCWQAMATTSTVFRAVRRPAARAASSHHVILPSTCPTLVVLIGRVLPPADGANTAAGSIAWSRPRSTVSVFGSTLRRLSGCLHVSLDLLAGHLTAFLTAELLRLRSTSTQWSFTFACQNTAQQAYRHKSAIKFALIQ